MGKYYFFAILLCSLTFSLKSQAAGFSGGKGTETEPYLIKTAQDLEDMADAITIINYLYRICQSKLFVGILYIDVHLCCISIKSVPNIF